ncbi:lauroyl-Kdo(2)-lipid IV(A) myristoyltransferase [Candidatus Pantoea carbekii]|uniref:Lipid A biosynthesis acyltransferase n=1 Tax=Candidatus Pantoea carbekii TaxID=1235990 RepID=U3U9M3_9GAMM|nr:lauroyl-Kdo(2)-lipid IV(A) myristoyltransferase [Candidatus Pantoea carbekii]AKC32045.1 lipid A biosynthesis MsbB [Candidatus Pantoea carbekii]BAO00568.1 lipid A biosynthesis (KDO)2-(lauroyl)-lipid IVA acyltransferase [Candidatus Pantoea carbekii]
MKTRKTSNIKNKIEFVPVFKSSFLRPKYWFSWLVISFLICMSMLSVKIRDPILNVLGKLISKLAKNARRRARINLYYCLPELNEVQREQIIENMFSTALQAIVMMVELALYNSKNLRKRIEWYGREIIDALKNKKENVIFLVPHGWSVDMPAMLLASEGKMMAAMFHHQSDLLIDYLWNTIRRRFGGRMHARKDGIKPFVNSIRQGYYGYYLPDQDYGTENSEFVDFFATYKATLTVLGRLMKVCHACIVPMFPVYNSMTHRLEIYVRPAMNDLLSADNKTLARRVNEEIEKFVRPFPEQYTWVLKLLKTRKQGEIEPYARNDLYPLK